MWLFAAACVIGLLLSSQPVFAANPETGLSARARAQIESLAEAKAKRTPAEAKIESALLTASQLSRGRALPGGVRVRSVVKTDADGRARVAIHGKVTPAVIDRVRELGGAVRSSRRRTVSSVPTSPSARSSRSVTSMRSSASRRSPTRTSHRQSDARQSRRPSRSVIGSCASACRTP
jgi:hypothetical protein